MRTRLHSLGAALVVSPAGLAADALLPGDGLAAGERLTSPNGRYALVMQPDGDLVLCRGDATLWRSGTAGLGSPSCHLQDDGNLVVYGARGGRRVAAWNSGTAGRQRVRLACQDDGNLVLYSDWHWFWSAGVAWATHTRGGLPTEAAAAAPAAGPPYRVLEVALDPEPRRVEAWADTVAVPRGAVVRVKKSRTIEHGAEVSDLRAVELALGGKQGVDVRAFTAELSQEVRVRLDAATRQHLKQSETVEQEVQLDGGVHPLYTVTWVDQVRTGRAVVRGPDGRSVPLAFRLTVSSELRVAHAPAK
jgi:hypothetical protein